MKKNDESDRVPAESGEQQNRKRNILVMFFKGLLASYQNRKMIDAKQRSVRLENSNSKIHTDSLTFDTPQIRFDKATALKTGNSGGHNA